MLAAVVAIARWSSLIVHPLAQGDDSSGKISISTDPSTDAQFESMIGICVCSAHLVDMFMFIIMLFVCLCVVCWSVIALHFA